VRPRWPYDMRPSVRAEKYIRDASACRKVHDELTITGRTDRQTDRVRRMMRPPPREEGRIITVLYFGPPEANSVRFHATLNSVIWSGAAEGKEKWGPNTHKWRARAYIIGVWGRSPQRGSRGQSPRWGSGGRSPPAADEVLCLKQ